MSSFSLLACIFSLTIHLFLILQFIYVTNTIIYPQKCAMRRQALLHPSGMWAVQIQQSSAPKESLCPSSGAQQIVWVHTVSSCSLGVCPGRQAGWKRHQLHSKWREDKVFVTQGMGIEPRGCGGKGVARGTHYLANIFLPLGHWSSSKLAPVTVKGRQLCLTLTCQEWAYLIRRYRTMCQVPLRFMKNKMLARARKLLPSNSSNPQGSKFLL